jgi:V8-like Glu-specific endopeptidase
MKVFVAERHLPGITVEQLGEAQAAAIRESDRASASGTPVHYLRSMYVPGDERCACLFEAENADDVRRVNDAAGVPYTRVVEALDLRPPSA